MGWNASPGPKTVFLPIDRISALVGMTVREGRAYMARRHGIAALDLLQLSFDQCTETVPGADE